MTTPGPGWHPDPEGHKLLRYWDGQQWTSATQPMPTPQPTELPPETPEAAKKRKQQLIGISVVIAAVAAIAIFQKIDFGKDDTPAVASKSTTSESTQTTMRTTTSQPPTTTRSAAEVSASAAAATSARAASEAAAAAAAEAKRQAEAAKLDPNTYESISDRDFALFAKNPDTYKGRKLTLYGIVTQADAATGNKMFLARTAGSPQDASYSYDQNTIVTAVDPTLIADVVEDDFVTLHVEVLGSQSYDTQRGGNTTAPKVQVNIVTVTGSK